MELTEQQSAAFISQLQKRAWKINGDLIYSPHKELWFPYPKGWNNTLEDLRKTMVRRLEGFKDKSRPSHLPVELLAMLVSDHISAIESIDAIRSLK